MRKPVWVWAVAVVGVLAAAGMRIAGETQMFKVGVELWALPLLAGLLVPAVVMLAGWRRGRNARADKEAVEGVKAEAREAHRTFVGRLDHELKNPLMALRVGLGEVRDPVLAESMRVQVDRLASLVAELRKISEIDSYPVADEPVDVSEVVSEVDQGWGELARSKEVRLIPGHGRGSRSKTQLTLPTVTWCSWPSTTW